MEYLGAWGTLIHEKNLKSKISCQTPFNPFFHPSLQCTNIGDCTQCIIYKSFESVKKLFDLKL